MVSAKIASKSPFHNEVHHFDPKFHAEGDISHQPFVADVADRPVNALQLCRWQFSHKQTLQHTFFDRSRFFDGNDKIVAFEAPLGGLGATETVHLRLIVKLLLSSY